MDKKRKRPERGWCLIHSFTHLSIHPPIHPLTQQTFNEDLLRAGLPLWLHCLQCGRPGFHPWVGKILWRRERLPTPVFWPGKFHGPWGCKEPSDSFTLLSQLGRLPPSAGEEGWGSGLEYGGRVLYKPQVKGLDDSLIGWRKWRKRWLKIIPNVQDWQDFHHY